MAQSARPGGRKNVLFLTARQSPAPELVDDLTRGLGPDVIASEAGLLDGLSIGELRALSAGPGHPCLAVPLRNGAIIKLSRQKLSQMAQEAITRSPPGAYDLIVLTGTGVNCDTGTARRVITAEHAVRAAIAAIATPQDRIGIVVPLARQLGDTDPAAFTRFRTRMTHAAPADPNGMRRAARELVACDFVLLNALCYDEQDRRLMAKLTGKPVFLPRRIIATAIDLVLGAPPARTDTRQECAKNLTPRERQVMAVVCKGLSNKEIARHLGISHKTVEIHRSNILRKMNARSSAALISRMAGADLT
ncbi:AroM family protein [Paracoccus sp. (in: a-proteobacteria)]|uniref:AroM family protein n=1 Tax=Paracoccus sp. TaxID=267 RepID=UPI003A858715